MSLENLWSEADYLFLKIRDATTKVETRSQRIRYKAYKRSNNTDDVRFFGNILKNGNGFDLTTVKRNCVEQYPGVPV